MCCFYYRGVYEYLEQIYNFIQNLFRKYEMLHTLINQIKILKYFKIFNILILITAMFFFIFSNYCDVFFQKNLKQLYGFKTELILEKRKFSKKNLLEIK